MIKAKWMGLRCVGEDASGVSSVCTVNFIVCNKNYAWCWALRFAQSPFTDFFIQSHKRFSKSIRILFLLEFNLTHQCFRKMILGNVCHSPAPMSIKHPKQRPLLVLRQVNCLCNISVFHLISPSLHWTCTPSARFIRSNLGKFCQSVRIIPVVLVLIHFKAICIDLNVHFREFSFFLKLNITRTPTSQRNWSTKEHPITDEAVRLECIWIQSWWFWMHKHRLIT